MELDEFDEMLQRVLNGESESAGKVAPSAGAVLSGPGAVGVEPVVV